MDRAWMGVAARPMPPYPDFGVFGGTPWTQDTPIEIEDEIIAPNPDISASPKAQILLDTLDKQSGQQNETAIKDGQVRKGGGQAAPQAPDISASFDIHFDGNQEEIELRVDQHRKHVKPKYQRPKRDRIYCKQCDSSQKGFRGEHELRRHQYHKLSDPPYQEPKHEDEDELLRH